LTDSGDECLKLTVSDMTISKNKLDRFVVHQTLGPKMLTSVVYNFLEGRKRNRNIILVSLALLRDGFCDTLAKSPDGRELSRRLREHTSVDQRFVCSHEILKESIKFLQYS
jgi:hypothetical protein